MHIDKQEISSVSNKFLITAKQHKINSCKGVQGLLADVPKLNSDFQSVLVIEYCAKSLAPLEATPKELFFYLLHLVTVIL